MTETDHSLHDHHGHHAHHAHGSMAGKVLKQALLLTFGYAIIEALAGWWANSLALIGDAGHMITDGIALGLAAFAAWLVKQPVSRRLTYGLGRAEFIAALINTLFMLVVVIGICVAAVERLMHSRDVAGEAITIVAFIGLVVNLIVAWRLSQSGQNINVRAALLHVFGDLAGSIAALTSGVVITLTGWTAIDPLLSIVICLLILVSTLRLLRESLLGLMEGVPRGLDADSIAEGLRQIPGVVSVHELHVWNISSEQIALSAHLIIDRLEDWERILPLAAAALDQLGIKHHTLQPEPLTRKVIWHNEKPAQ